MNGCLYFLPGSHRDGSTNPYFDTSTAYKLWAVQPGDVKAYMIAALASEHGGVVYSNDRDFERFPDLVWRNPLD